MPRSRFDLILGLLFGLMLSIPARAALRPQSSGSEQRPGKVQIEEKAPPVDVSKEFKDRLKEAESEALFFFKDNVLADTKRYSEKDGEAIKIFVSRRSQGFMGFRKELRWTGKFDLHIPIDWTFEAKKENQGYFFQSDDQLVRGAVFFIPVQNRSKSDVLNDYLSTIKDQAGDQPFEVIKGDTKVAETWTGVSYTCLTRTKVGEHWLYQRRFVAFDREGSFVLSIGSWKEIFELWDPVFIKIGKELTLKVTERLERQ